MALATTMMDSSANIYRPKIARDSRGGVTQTFDPAAGATTVASGIPCNVNESNPSPQTLYFQRETGVNTTIYFIQDPGVQINDILVITHCRTGIVKTYLSHGNSRSDTHGRLWVAPAERIDAPGT